MNEQLQQRLERLSERIEKADKNGDYEQAAELKIELNAVKQVLSERNPGA